MWDRFLNYPVEVYAAADLVLTNVVDPRWWWAVGVVAVLAVVASVVWGKQTRGLRWWQQGAVVTLQIAVVLGALGLLAGPALQTAVMQPGANTVAVMVDTSASMGFPNRPDDDGPTRLDAAVSLLEAGLEDALRELGDVAVFGFDTAAARIDTVPRVVGEGDTRLVAATDAVLSSFKGMPLAAVVVLSDGADNDEVSALDVSALASHGVPVHTIGFGPAVLPGEAQLTDVRITADAPPQSRVSASVVIEHASEGDALVKVRNGGTLLAARRVTLSEDAPTQRVEVAFDSGAAGIRELSFELEPPGGDSLAQNNRIDRLLTVSERRRRVLYLEGEPRWEYKFLRRAMAGDDVIELVSWLRTTNRKTYRQGVAGENELEGGFPADLEALYAYDVVILGSLSASALNETQHRWLESFVSERGGSLLALGGRESLENGRWDVQPLAAALPVYLRRPTGLVGDDAGNYGRLEGMARPTRAGMRSPMTQLVDAEGGSGWASLPRLGDIHRLGELKPAATTMLELEEGENRHPLLVIQPYGLGTSAVLATASTWRWQMRTPPDDPRHGLFWRQLLRQLAELAQQQHSVKLAVDAEGITVRAWIRDEVFAPAGNLAATAVVTHPDRTTDSVNLGPGSVPGLLAARYVPPGPGVYRFDVSVEDTATLGDAQTSVAAPVGTVTRFVRAGAAHKEYFRPTLNAGLLSRIAEDTGGRYWSVEDAVHLPTALTFSSSGIRSVEVLPLWNLPLFFLLLMLLKIAEWGLRRLWGRV